MRAEKNGFVLIIEGTWCEISNRYGVVEHGDLILPDEVPEDFAETMLDKFIQEHSVRNFGPLDKDCIKRVAYDAQSKEYIQLQAVHSESDKVWTVQKYDDEFVYMGEIWSGCEYQDEVKDWMHSNYQIESGLIAYVFRDSLGDCTNGGISSARRELYIMTKEKYPFEPEDLRECIGIEFRECCGEKYVDAKPLYFPRRWYMAGGNFLYTSDSRYKEITGISYPVSIHDRYEGR